MDIILCTVPSESSTANMDSKSRSLGELPVLPKYAICSLVDWMRKNGVTDEQFDFFDIDMLLPTDTEIFRLFEKHNPLIVGLSAVTSGAYNQVKRISNLIRQACPATLIVLGGNLAASANVILRKTEIDICVVGDGEVSWMALVDYVKQYGNKLNIEVLRQTQGLSFLNENGELIFTGYGVRLASADMCTVPDYALLKRGLQGRTELLRNYFRPGLGSSWFNHHPKSHEPHRLPNLAVVVTTKGCVAKCTFCQRSTKGYRVGQPKDLDEHLFYLKEHHRVGFVMIADENFGSDRKVAIEVANVLKKHDIIWTATGIRVDSVDRELVKFFADNNCVGFKFGVESGSQRILDLMEKKFSTDNVISAVGWAREFGMFSPLAIMLGMPGEDYSTIQETAKMLAEIAFKSNSGPFEGKEIFYAIPFPGTPLYEYGQQVGAIGTSVDAEEYYLQNVFAAQSYKLSYINLNGAPVNEVLFWDILVQIESVRAYLKLASGQTSAVETNMKPAIVLNETISRSAMVSKQEKQSGILTRILTRIREKRWQVRSIPPIMSNFIQKRIITNVNFILLPKAVLYPLIRTFLYIEYFATSIVAKLNGQPYYQAIRPRSNVKRIDNSYKALFPNRKIVSIRNITRSSRLEEMSSSEGNRITLASGM